MALPTFPKLLEEITPIIAEAGYGRTLAGGMEYEFYLPIMAGDTLEATPKVIGGTERETKTGKMVFMVIETTFINQKGEVAAKVRQTTIHR